MPALCDRFLPPGLAPERVVARVGLLSDTHLPQRCAALPATLFDALLGVDLVLHAGDVGDLYTLDALSTVAPVVAVHGNDDSEEATVALPYAQVVAVGGRRVLLTHAHYPNHLQEMASRRDDRWLPKLERRAALAHEAGADIVVFGHTHVPMTLSHDGVLLVNPGAIAPPNLMLRQATQSVALLFMRDDGAAFVQHVNLGSPMRVFTPTVNWDAGFGAAYDAVTASIITPALAADLPRLAALGRLVAPEASEDAYLRLARRCWLGELAVITHADLLMELQADNALSPSARAALTSVLAARGTPAAPAFAAG